MEWLLVRSKPRQERKAKRWISEQGCEPYLPYAFDPVTKRSAPLFSSYLFALASPDNWGFINYSFGVRNVVTFGDQAAVIPSYVIDKLKASEDVDGLIHLPKPGSLYKKGDQIRVKFGSFVGQLGIYQGMNAQQRVHVLMNILNRQTRVTLDPSMVEATGQSLH